MAGVIEMSGGKVTFPTETDEGVSLFANKGAHRVGITVVTGQVKDKKVSYVVPEPVGSNRVVAVTATSDGHKGVSGSYAILDLTEAPRQNFGGFSVIQGEVRPNGQIKIDGMRNLLTSDTKVEDLVHA